MDQSPLDSILDQDTRELMKESFNLLEEKRASTKQLHLFSSTLRTKD